MTALSEYQRLESTGLWRDKPDAQRREVVVGFRDASLVISDIRSETPLAHWSLPAITRLNPGALPAVYSPGGDQGESLEIADETLAAAIDKVHRLIDARKPHPGRLRRYLLGGGMAIVLGLGLFWLPGEMVRHTASVVPDAKRQEIGRAVLADIARVSGAPCGAGQGPRSLGQLSTRLGGSDAMAIAVLPGAVSGARALPGDLIILGRDLVEDHESAEVAAGHILAARLRATTADPIIDLLHWAGLRATFRLLTTGILTQDDIAGYGEALLATAPRPLPDEALLAAFAAAGVPSSPYAYARDVSGESVLGLIEADPFRTTPATAVLADADWVALQGICGD